MEEPDGHWDNYQLCLPPMDLDISFFYFTFLCNFSSIKTWEAGTLKYKAVWFISTVFKKSFQYNFVNKGVQNTHIVFLLPKILGFV